MDMKQDIDRAARELVAEVGLINLSRAAVCQRAGVKNGSFSHHMGMTFFDYVGALKAEGIPEPLVKVSKSRVNPDLRRDQVVRAGMLKAEHVGFARLTRRDVAEWAGVSPGFVTKLFGTMPQLKRAVMRYAVKCGNVVVVAQGLAIKDRQALKAPPELRERAGEWLKGGN